MLNTDPVKIPDVPGKNNEFRQQTRMDPAGVVSAYKVKMINEILAPLKEMMKDEEYAGYLKPVEVENMRYGDVMMLIAQYKSALKEYRRTHDI